MSRKNLTLCHLVAEVFSSYTSVLLRLNFSLSVCPKKSQMPHSSRNAPEETRKGGGADFSDYRHPIVEISVMTRGGGGGGVDEGFGCCIRLVAACIGSGE